MAEQSIMEGMKAYVKDMERELNEDWGKWLAEDELQIVKDALASFAAEEYAFMEKAWCPDNKVRLENQIRELVDDLIEKAQNEAEDSTAAGENAETYDELFNRVKITVSDGPEDDPGSYTVMGEIEENRPSDNDEAAVEFTVCTKDMEFQVSYPRGDMDEFEIDDDDLWRDREMSANAVTRYTSISDQDDDQTMTDDHLADENAGDSSPVYNQQAWKQRLGEGDDEATPEASCIADDDTITQYAPSEDGDVASVAGPSNYQEMASYYHDMGEETGNYHDDSRATFQPTDIQKEDDDDSDYLEDPKGKKPQKGKGTTSSNARYEGNHLWDVVMGTDKPNGPPVGYICKVASCDNWQGKWKCRQSHFEALHPEEWFSLTGKRHKVFKCSVCGWTTKGASYLRKHKKQKHGIQDAQSEE